MQRCTHQCSTFFFFTDAATTAIYTLSLHERSSDLAHRAGGAAARRHVRRRPGPAAGAGGRRSEEHTSELQSHVNLVCRLLLEKKKAPASTAYDAIVESSRR